MATLSAPSLYAGSRYIVKKGDFRHTFNSVRELSVRYPLKDYDLLDCQFIWQKANGQEVLLKVDPRVDPWYR